jgi:serine protease AprX
MVAEMQQAWNEPASQSTTPGVFPALSIPIRLRTESRYTGKGVCIVLIDSGFVPHPDLTMPENRILVYYDAVNRVESPLPPTDGQFYSWHGTMTACTAAGNGWLSHRQYTSPAPDASVILIRVMQDNGRIPTPVIVEALDWCVKHREQYSIDIVNLSVYADEDDNPMEHPVTLLVEELVARGVTVVAASGNNPSMPLRPPAIAPSAVTVGGLDDKNTLLDDQYTLYNSSYGITALGLSKPEVIAPAIWLPAPILPGTQVHTEAAALCALDSMTNEQLLRVLPLLITDTALPAILLQETDASVIREHIDRRLSEEKIISPSYKHVDGTSFAAPIVCSVIAQMLEANPRLNPAHIKNILISTADFMHGFPRECQGYGRVDAVAALRMALRIS